MRGSANKIGHKDGLLGNVVAFANDNENKPIYEITKEIKVKVIDWHPIIKKIKDSNPKFADVEFEIRSGDGIILVGDGKPVLIDDECCGIDSERKNMMLDGNMVVAVLFEGIGIFEVHKRNEDGTRSISMMPKWYVDFDWDDVKACLTGEEKELWEFMGQRYEYNSRIHNNMRGIVKLWKGMEV